jgi:hypothetical protein
MKHKAFIEVAVSKVADSDFPVWLECSLKDSNGIEHLIVEKVPVLTSVEISENQLPSSLKIECNVISTQENQVTIELLHGIESTKGVSRFTVHKNTYYAS